MSFPRRLILLNKRAVLVPLLGAAADKEATSAMIADLAAIVGPERVSDDPALLESYGRDFSLVQPRRPRCVVFATTPEEIQAIVKYADERHVAITPRSSAVGFYGAGIPSQGGILLDLTRMNRILKIDPPDKRVMIEPGVTYAQLQAALAVEGLQVCNPLLPHPAKSALTSSLEREPILIPRPEYDETFLTAGIVLASGELLRTGSALGKGITSGIYPEGLFPGSNLYKGAQGTLGIVAWANLKAEWLPKKDKVLFLAFDRAEQVPDPVYAILRRHVGRECLILNAHNLATILADDWSAEFLALRAALPPYTVILCLSGGHRLPEERIAYEEEALHEIAFDGHFAVQHTVAGLAGLGARLLPLLRQPWLKSATYWKHRYKGGCQDVFFHITLDQVPRFIHLFEALAAKHGFSSADLGIYVQPLEYGRVSFCQVGLPCDPTDGAEMARVRALYLDASEQAIQAGALFSTPYGPWAEMVYRRAAGYTATLKVVKDAFDPNRILNPGKLCL